ncbi:MAG: hypothetical protein EP329_04910 [Deltaproteobacteria bacterium]|nr:MAG: hypothetical protein EP329_04910 [Deltaproteobacteria bacterium]
MLKRIVVVLAGLGFVSVSACGGGDSPVKAMNDFADKICKCENQECAMAVVGEMAKAGEKFKDYKPTEDDIKAMADVQKKIADCQAKMATKGAEGAGEGGAE